MNRKVYNIKKCDCCGVEVKIYHKDRLNRKNIFCSKKCEGTYRKNQTAVNCICDYCGKSFHIKPSRITKNTHHCCSKECSNNLKAILYKGENNHQYGLKGKLNASWKNDKKVTNYGYIKIRSLNHPFKDCDGFVFEHRLIAEQYLLDDENSVLIDGKKYLKPEYIVHHINGNKQDNRKENLKVMTLAAHTTYHKKKRKI